MFKCMIDYVSGKILAKRTFALYNINTPEEIP